MGNLNAKVHNAKSLLDICELLNGFNSTREEGDYITDYVDLHDMPVFSEDVPEQVMECYSYDDSSMLVCIPDTNHGTWSIIPKH